MIVRTFGLFQNPLFNEHTYQYTRGGSTNGQMLSSGPAADAT